MCAHHASICPVQLKQKSETISLNGETTDFKPVPYIHNYNIIMTSHELVITAVLCRIESALIFYSYYMNSENINMCFNFGTRSEMSEWVSSLYRP